MNVKAICEMRKINAVHFEFSGEQVFVYSNVEPAVGENSAKK
jgi:hypothetical protein